MDALDIHCVSLNIYLKYDLFISTRMNCIVVVFFFFLQLFCSNHLKFIRSYLLKYKCLGYTAKYRKNTRSKFNTGDILKLVINQNY